ncbi:cytochrome P450 1A1-like [Saccostrea cucullata]|uniref:cytochrome P450 1A1-like n=1 Tax=Saccostrea cuccullata TaxID=36930 RepID=UPI002ED022D4
MTILGSKLSMNFQPNQKTSDIVVILTVLSAILVTMKLILGWRRRPPGPWGLPVLGHLPFLGSRPLNKFKQYQKEYGDVVFLRFGTWPTVIISGKDTVKSTLALDTFASRPPFFSIKSLSDMKGLSFCFFDERYLLHRKIASSVVREFGGSENSVLKDALREESNILVSSFLAKIGPFNPSELLYVTTGSIIFQFCYGKGENIRENPAFLKVMEDQAIFKEFFTAGNYFDVLPWLRYIMPGKFKRFLELIDHFQKARKEIGAPIMDTYDPAHPRHAFDGFLNACLKYNITDTPSEEGLTKTQLTETLLEIFGAGFETTASTLRWALMYYAEYQDVQMKVQKEIDEKIGRNKVISIKDRLILPYTEATILEIMRVAPVVPMALPHMTTTDVVLKGNLIEKGTVVFFNIMSLMHDDYWGNPNEFQPERFLDEDGCLLKEKVDNVLAFGAGRRICLGKMIAQAEIFYLLATLLQNCRICKPKNVQYDFEGEYGLSYFPKEYEICVQSR